MPFLVCAFLLNFENCLSRDSELQEIMEQIGGLEIASNIYTDHRTLKIGDRCVWKACFVKRVFSPFDFSYLH